MDIQSDEFVIQPCCSIEYCAVRIGHDDPKKITIIPVRIKYCPLCGNKLVDD